MTVVDFKVDHLAEKQEAKLFEYIEIVHTSVNRAENLAVQLELRHLNARESSRNNAQTALWASERSSGQLEIMALNLPPIPKPTFGLKIWDFVNSGIYSTSMSAAKIL